MKKLSNNLETLPPASLNNFLANEYKKIKDISDNLEKSLLLMVINSTKEENSLNNLQFLAQCTPLYRQFRNFYTMLCAVEELTMLTASNLTKEESIEYRLQIINGFCFFFFANQVFSYFFSRHVLPDSWLSISYSLCKVYPRLKDEFHKSKKPEIRLGQTLIILIQELSRSFSFLKEQQAREHVINTLQLFYSFIDNVKYTQMKPHYYLVAFRLETYPITRSFAEDLKRISLTKEDYYLKNILACIDKNSEKLDDKLFYFLAHATCFYNKALKIHEKIIGQPDSTVANNLSSDNRLLINLKNAEETFSDLQKIINNSMIVSGLNIGGIYNNAETPFVLEKILQTKELAGNLLIIYKRSLEQCKLVTEYFISKIKTLNNTNLYLDFLELDKKIICLLIKIDLHCSMGSEFQSDENLLSQFDHVVCEHQIYAQQQAECNPPSEEHNKKQDENKLTSSKKSLKKIEKENRLRDAYRKSKKVVTASTDKNIYNELFSTALKFFSEGNFLAAKEKYEEIFKHEVHGSINHINTLIALGDVYKRWSQLQKRKLNAKNALQYYRKAQTLATERAKTADSVSKNEYESLFDIAKVLADEMEMLFRPIKKEKTNIVQLNNQQNSTTKSLQPTLAVNPTFLKMEMPLPKIVEDLSEFLYKNNMEVFVVGGFVRDFFLKLKPFDIDLIIINYNSPTGIDMEELVTLIKSRFPQAEIRSKKHPIIYLEDKNSIIELSPPKTSPEKQAALSLQPLEERYKLVWEILHNDGEHRGTTDNAIYYHIRKKKFIDFFKGLEHLDENRLESIKKPGISFEEDATLIFRVIRSIIRRSINNPFFTYNPMLINSISVFVEKIRGINKNRCFTEIHKFLFRGNALATWQFLQKMGLENSFWLLPSDTNRLFRHSLMMARMLGNLDQRIQKKLSYNENLVFAVLLWGYFEEKLELFLKTMKDNPSKTITNLVYQSFADTQLLFTLPPQIKDDIMRIWLGYLVQNKIIELKELIIDYKFLRLIRVFSQLISYGTLLAPEEKFSQQYAANKLGFFKNNKTEYMIKEIINQHKFSLNKTEKSFCIALGSECIISLKDKENILKQLTNYFKMLFGKFNIKYALNHNSVTITTDAVLKYYSIAREMEFLFEHEKNLQMSYKC